MFCQQIKITILKRLPKKYNDSGLVVVVVVVYGNTAEMAHSVININDTLFIVKLLSNYLV